MVGVTQVLPCVPDVLAVLPNRFKVSLECWNAGMLERDKSADL
jgi:hypothetical protein